MGLQIQAILSNTHLIFPIIKEETDYGPIGHTPQGLLNLMINIVRKDFNLPLIFSPCLCEYLCPPESDQFCIAGRTKCAKSAQWTIYWTLTLSSRLPIWRILHISCCLWCRIGQIPRQRGEVSTSRWTNPEALETTWTRTWIFLEAATGRPDRPSRPALTGLQGWPDHLTSLAPYWPNTWPACYLSGKGSGASQSGSIWSTERGRLVLREVQLLEHLDLRLETWTIF